MRSKFISYILSNNISVMIIIIILIIIILIIIIIIVVEFSCDHNPFKQSYYIQI